MQTKQIDQQMVTNNLAAAVARIGAAETYLNTQYFEKAEMVKVALLALSAGEHAAFIGSPGIAKSAVVRTIRAMISARYFEYLLTRFSEPNEVFGTVKVNTLLADSKYVRNTDDMLPSAEIAFLDEAFKANSAILNALLTLLNERLFDNGGQRLTVPLHSAFLASNELPSEGNLNALWDRCLLRMMLKPVQEDDNWEAMVFGDGQKPVMPTLSLDDFMLVNSHAANLPFSKKVRAACKGIRAKMLEKNIPVSDRSWVKAVQRILRGYAAMRGATEVSEEHIDVLRYVLWEKPTDIPFIEEVVEQHAAAWIGAVRELTAKLDEAASRLNNAKGMMGGNRLRALADLTDLMEPIAAEATAVHKTYNRQETSTLVKRATDLANEAISAARPRA